MIIHKYILSHIVSDLSQHSGQNITFDRRCLYLTIWGKTLNSDCKIWCQKITRNSLVWCTTYFDILNHLGVDHHSPLWQTDGQTDETLARRVLKPLNIRNFKRSCGVCEVSLTNAVLGVHGAKDLWIIYVVSLEWQSNGVVMMKEINK